MSDTPRTETSTADTARQSAGSAAGDAVDQARQAGARASADARDVAQEARQRGQGLAADVKDRVLAAAEDRKESVADQLEDVAKAVFRSGEQLEGHQDWMAGMVERGAAELRSLASALRGNDLQGLLGNLEDLARRQPAVFVGASMAAGFAMVRVGRLAAAGASRADLPSSRPSTESKAQEVTREHE